MENKPIVILGGGLWGGLLAYRLAQIQPEVEFLLYERNSTLGGNKTWFFHESELEQEDLQWMAPFIDRSWDFHQVHFPEKSRQFEGKYHSISSDRFHQKILDRIPHKVKLNNELPLELAVGESSFVIDARNDCLIKNSAFQKYMSLEVELEHEHGLKGPIIMDAVVTQKDGYRFMSYLPLSDKNLLVRDTRYSHQDEINLQELRSDINEVLVNRNWHIKRVLREENNLIPVPLSAPLVQEEGKVVSLAGLFHDTTGDSLVPAINLIDKMVKSSFRLGELKKITHNFRKKHENQRRFFRFINRMMFELYNPKDRYRIFQHVYHLPENVLHRFYRGELKMWDKSRFIMGENPLESIKKIRVRNTYSNVNR